MEPIAVDLQTAAKMTSLSTHTLRIYVRRKLLKATKCGRRVLIPVTALRELIDTGAPKRSE